MKQVFSIFILAFVVCSCNSKPNLDAIELKKLDGDTLKLDEIKNHRATVIYFLSPECPLCQNYSLSMREMHQQYGDDDVLFLGVFPGKWYSEAEIKAYTLKYNLQFTMLLDDENTLVNSLGATVTPEVYLISSEGEIEYEGRIDDWVGTLGTKKKNANNEYLKNAIIAFLSSKSIDPSKTTAVGCLIE